MSLNNDLPTDSFPEENSQIVEREILQSHDISLLEEKLVVQRLRQKIGEVVVRKEIETRMIHIPIRREKLIVEKVGVTTEHLTEIDLGEEKVNGVKFSELQNADSVYQAQSNFISLEALQKLLPQIANNLTRENMKVRLEIITDCPESQKVCQDICNQF